MQKFSLEERTERHPQLKERRGRFSEVPIPTVQAHLASAGSKFVGSGSFCRVWRVDRWSFTRSEARGLPVVRLLVPPSGVHLEEEGSTVIKVCSAEFKELMEEERRSKQNMLVRHWNREVNAHLLLDGQPRVVRVFHTFKGSLVVPPVAGRPPHEARRMQVVGLVEEYCNQTSLSNFLWALSQQPMGSQALMPLEHVAAEFLALMGQVGELQRIGVVHQDIKGDNLMVHVPTGTLQQPGMPLLKLGDLNGVQWEELTRDGRSWMGTVGFMPRRVRRLYLGQQGVATGVGELNYDTYQMGKVLLRTLLELNGINIKYVRKDENLEAEEVEVKSSAIHMLSLPAPAGEPDKELWTFGVVIGLAMTWDEAYTSKADQLRLTPGEAVEVLEEWARLCRAWRAAGSSAAFWGSAANVGALATLYLRLAELARLPPLDEPMDPGVHTQTDEYLLETLDNFFLFSGGGLYGGQQQRMALVKAQVKTVLSERKAAAAAAAAAAAEAARQAAEEAERQRLLRQKRDKPSGGLRSTAWETKVYQRAEAEEAFLDGSSSALPGPSDRRQGRGENKAINRLAVAAPAAKRKAGAAGAGGAAAKKPRPAAAAAGGRAGDAGAGAGAGARAGAPGGQADLLVLSSKLRLKDIWGEGVKPAADGPQVLGPQHAAAQMLADTVRAAAAAAAAAAAPAAANWAAAGRGGGGEVRLHLGGGRTVRFGLTARRSVQFSRGEFLALAQAEAACRRWNQFVEAALGAWVQQGKEGSRVERLRLLAPLLAG